jgi:hypothetical protein
VGQEPEVREAREAGEPRIKCMILVIKCTALCIDGTYPKGGALRGPWHIDGEH